ncbi:hypothetical protein [Streptomyces sp. NPDC048196]|uniref:hypothetical protein n=1 Tax=Streptomyces sp. NPDC048196 TaxID=3154712 RepID=UPI0033EC63FE
MTASTRCDCGSTLDLRDIVLDSASGPGRTVTFCGACAPKATLPVPAGVSRVLARRAGVRLPDDPVHLHGRRGRD